MFTEHSQEYTQEIDQHKKQEIEALLQQEGGKSRFRARIQLTLLYIIASAVMLICLLATNYTVYDLNKLYYVPLIVCSIISLVLYGIYFWRWITDFKKIKNYVQKRWNIWYFVILILTSTAFFISFLCTLITVCLYKTHTVGLFYLSDQTYPIYGAILFGIIFDILFTLIASSLDTYVIYHVEIDLQKLIKDYDENQVDFLRQKIQQETHKLQQEEINSQVPASDLNNEQHPVQNKLTQEEIDRILKENSNLTNDLDNDNEH